MSGGASAVLPIAGAAAGFMMGGPAGAMMGMQLGSAARGLAGGSSSNGQLGSPQQAQVVGAQQLSEPNPFDSYAETGPTGAMPSNVQNMNLPTSTEAPGGANKSAMDKGMGYASTAMQAVAAARASQQQQEMIDAEIAARKWRNPTIVQGPSASHVSTSMGGGFPSIGQGFSRY